MTVSLTSLSNLYEKSVIILTAIVLVTSSCQKGLDTLPGLVITPKVETTLNQFVEYNILKGQQYCDKSMMTKVEYETLKFVVIFDSSAIYQTVDPANQADINKLYGFADNNAQHHDFSARFGWNWNIKDGLCLYAYTYNNGVRSSKLLSIVSLQEAHECAIKVTPESYIFSLDAMTFSMPRTSTTAKGSGYKLFPYFGGDEVAPHHIKIRIKEM